MSTDFFPNLHDSSPRLKWMERNHLTVRECADHDDPETSYEVLHGLKVICDAPTKDEAITMAARILNIRLWNEQ